jgi:hypothetical protein
LKFSFCSRQPLLIDFNFFLLFNAPNCCQHKNWKKLVYLRGLCLVEIECCYSI